MLNRAEHLAWAKTRAREYLDRGDAKGALGSLLMDLDRHEELKDHRALGHMMTLLLAGKLETVDEMRKHIEAIN